MKRADVQLAVIVAAGVAIVLAMSKAGAIAQRLATHELNPASSDNLANRAVEAVGQGITGDPHWTLGGAVYDATHDPVAPGDATKGDKGVAQTFADRYAAWVRSFWGVTAPSTPTTGDFARMDRSTGASSSTDDEAAYYDPMTGLRIN